jgi:hypothetical protein
MIKNNKGFGRFEVLTMTVLIICLSAYLLTVVLQKVNVQKYNTMIDSAISLSKTVANNNNSFHNTETIYLDEVISEGVLSRIKSPFSSGYCDGSQSKVEFINGLPYVTLKCDDYIIEKEKISDKQSVKIYKVGEWTTTKSSDSDEEATLYNCLDNGEELYDDYSEELYTVYELNNDNGTSYFFMSDVFNTCESISKTFYRTKTLVKRS